MPYRVVKKVYRPQPTTVYREAKRIREQGFIYQDTKRRIEHGPWTKRRIDNKGALGDPPEVRQEFSSIIVEVSPLELCGTTVIDVAEPWGHCHLP